MLLGDLWQILGSLRSLFKKNFFHGTSGPRVVGLSLLKNYRVGYALSKFQKIKQFDLAENRCADLIDLGLDDSVFGSGSGGSGAMDRIGKP